MNIKTFTLIHVVISLVGITSGLVVMYGLLTRRRLNGWTGLFLITTAATSVTGFGFPITHFGAPHIVGIISLVILAAAIFARYSCKLAGAWRWVYVITAALALYLNVFVGIAQAFQKIPTLNALAPTQTELLFAIAQLVVLVLFIVLTVVAVRTFRVIPV
ncbi:MAG TPA: hypothetical protein VGQ41_04115 [Pyrinomonadaceae bacterium]|nr:hypothetical protein [Pyrinomonadaceae bacterium]